jgi:hypothetical protein
LPPTSASVSARWKPSRRHHAEDRLEVSSRTGPPGARDRLSAPTRRTTDKDRLRSFRVFRDLRKVSDDGWSVLRSQAEPTLLLGYGRALRRGGERHDANGLRSRLLDRFAGQVCGVRSSRWRSPRVCRQVRQGALIPSGPTQSNPATPAEPVTAPAAVRAEEARAHHRAHHLDVPERRKSSVRVFQISRR